MDRRVVVAECLHRYGDAEFTPIRKRLNISSRRPRAPVIDTLSKRVVLPFRLTFSEQATLAIIIGEALQ